MELNCQCKICIPCFQRGYRVQIDDMSASVSLSKFSCLNCQKPEFVLGNDEIFQEHLSFLALLVSVKWNYHRIKIFGF